MRAYLSRWVCLDVDSNLQRCAEEAAAAAAAGADVTVFPESFLHGYSRLVDPGLVRAHFARVSEDHPGMMFVFGSFSEDRRNRMTLWRQGREIGRYDKVHLFAPNRERALWEEGDRYAAVDLGGWTLGLLNCNDLRFPEQARALRLQGGCRALAVVGWWPWRRDHVWRTLLRARALENGVWVLGCCVAASQWPTECFAGAGNYVFDPLGNQVTSADDLVFDIRVEYPPELVVDPAADFRSIATLELFDATGSREVAIPG